MPRLHLHLYNGMGFIPDLEGQEFPDAATAREQAVQSIRDLVSAGAKEGLVDLNGRVEVVDANGQLVAVVRFVDAIELRKAPEQ